MLPRYLPLVMNVGLIGLLLAATGCPANPEEKRVKFLEEARANREKRVKELKAMNETQLAKELEKDSLKGREPFNSMAFSELVARGPGVAPAFASALTHADRSSFIGLLALRKLDYAMYKSLPSEFRVKVLVDALKNSETFNAWGLPHSHWQEAARALIEEGEAAKPALISLLDDKRDAPSWGSATFTDSQRFHYRVRDYAWALLNEIDHEKTDIPTDIPARDQLIKEQVLQRARQTSQTDSASIVRATAIHSDGSRNMQQGQQPNLSESQEGAVMRKFRSPSSERKRSSMSQSTAGGV
jgi:hypothetical protein